MPPESQSDPISLQAAIIFLSIAALLFTVLILRLSIEYRTLRRLGPRAKLSQGGYLDWPSLQTDVDRLFLERRAIRQQIAQRPAWFEIETPPVEELMEVVDLWIARGDEAAATLSKQDDVDQGPAREDLDSVILHLANARVALEEGSLQTPEEFLQMLERHKLPPGLESQASAN